MSLAAAEAIPRRWELYVVFHVHVTDCCRIATSQIILPSRSRFCATVIWPLGATPKRRRALVLSSAKRRLKPRIWRIEMSVLPAKLLDRSGLTFSACIALAFGAAFVGAAPAHAADAE